MFDKFKQIQQLRQLQKQMAAEKVEIERGGNKIVINGNMEIVDLQLVSNEPANTQAGIIKDIFNEAIKEIQKKIATLMRGGGMF